MLYVVLKVTIELLSLHCQEALSTLLILISRIVSSISMCWWVCWRRCETILAHSCFSFSASSCRLKVMLLIFEWELFESPPEPAMTSWELTVLKFYQEEMCCGLGSRSGEHAVESMFNLWIGCRTSFSLLVFIESISNCMAEIQDSSWFTFLLNPSISLLWPLSTFMISSIVIW